MRKLLIILILTTGFAVSPVHSQTLQGTVTDSLSGAPVAGVIVQLLDRQGKVLSYTLSSSKGVFTLPVAENGVALAFKCLGYRSCRLAVPNDRTQPLSVAMQSETTQLPEIVVKAPDILQKSDTLVYNVQQYADAQDRSIADVLKKMPGVEVAESGQIKYNGTPINKFYIEGNDLLEGRYGIATNNISHRDVKNVEIMENHQPVRALQDVEMSEQAGMNLRLKENAKVRWTGIAGAGTGFSPALYDGSLFAMRIAGKLQSMETLRLNNTGWNPASQSVRHTSDKLFDYDLRQNLSPDYIAVGGYSTPLDPTRTRFNRSLLFNTANSMKISDDYDLKVNATYERDKLDFEHSAYTDYLDNLIAPYSESETLLADRHDVSLQAILQCNTPDVYLKNRLTADFGWNDVVANITDRSALTQTTKMPVLNVSNELQAVRRIKNQALTISSFNSVVSKPHSLSVDGAEQAYVQDVVSRVVQSATEASYAWMLGKWQVRCRTGFDLLHSRLESSLNGLIFENTQAENNSSFSRISLYARPDLVYETKHLLLNPCIYVNYNRFAFNDRLLSKKTANNNVTVSPALSVRVRFSAKTELFVNTKYSVVQPKTDCFQTGLILNDYRNLSVGYPSYTLDSKYSASLILRYRNPVSSVFANAGCSYERNAAALLHSQTFVNDYIIKTYQPALSRGEIYSVNGGVSKGVWGGKINVGIDAGYTRALSSSMRNSAVVPYSASVATVAPKIKGTLLRWMSVEYSLLASNNSMTFTGDVAKSSYSSLRQKLNVNLFPSKKLQLNAGGEHYRTRFDDNTSDNLLLVDVGARWLLSSSVDVAVSASNLMNSRSYACSRYGMLSETVYRYRLRPRNVLLSVSVKI
jgi:hypothetical protein